MNKWLLLCSVLLLCACSGGMPGAPSKNVKLGKPYSVNGMDFTPSYDPNYDETGLGSWYGPGFHGKRTANGEVFDQNDLTAAHPTLPMPSLVRVTNLTNDKSMVVRINDRGPFVRGRIIDLSKASAKQIGLHSTMPVRVEYLARETEEYWAQMEMRVPKDVRFSKAAPYPAAEVATAAIDTQPAAAVETVQSADLPPPATRPSLSLVSRAEASEVRSRDLPPVAPPKAADKPQEVVLKPLVATPQDTPASEPPPKPSTPINSMAQPGRWYVQAGSFAHEENATKLAKNLSKLGPTVVKRFDVGERTFWRVRVGPMTDRGDADTLQAKIDQMGVVGAKVVLGE